MEPPDQKYCRSVSFKCGKTAPSASSAASGSLVLSVMRALSFQDSSAVLYAPNARIAAMVCIKHLEGGFVEAVNLERLDVRRALGN
jgi:hypothetical protein